MPVDIVVDRPTHAIGTCGNVLLIAWRTRLDAAGAQETGTALAALAARFPAGVVVFSHVSPGCPIPDGPARDTLAKVIREQKALLADASTFDGGGLRQALVRSTVTMLNLMSAKRTPSDVFATVDAAAEWLVTKGAPGRVTEDAKALSRAMREVVAGSTSR